MAGKTVYRTVDRPGVTAVLVSGRRILLLRRIGLPFITHPGLWYFVAGARKGRETPLQNAYREIREEVGVGKGELSPVSWLKVTVLDHKKRQEWENDLFIIRSSGKEVRLNMEHTAHRWVGLDELKGYEETLACFRESGKLLKLIGSALRPGAKRARPARRSVS
jgi:8-oxo-dGTP pyrophosphatase MutT (NUDIX family)